jgi:hypothetical protein
MSTGAKMPALPPKTGCLACGQGHGAESCPLNREIIGQDMAAFRAVATVQLRRDARESAARKLARIAAATPVPTGSYDERMSADIAEGQARQLRATPFFRGQ